MKSRNIVRISIFIGLLYAIINISGCASSKAQQSEDTSLLDSLIAKKTIFIESQTAYPQVTNSMVSISNSGLLAPGNTAGSINIIGNSNFLRIKGDSVSGYLPYYGERQMGGYPGNTNTGIEFNDLANKYTVERGKKNGYIVQFTVPDKVNKTERYNVTLRVYPNMSSNIRVNSSQRFSIEYRGHIKPNSE